MKCMTWLGHIRIYFASVMVFMYLHLRWMLLFKYTDCGCGTHVWAALVLRVIAGRPKTKEGMVVISIYHRMSLCSLPLPFACLSLCRLLCLDVALSLSLSLYIYYVLVNWCVIRIINIPTLRNNLCKYNGLFTYLLHVYIIMYSIWGLPTLRNWKVLIKLYIVLI